MVTRPTTTFSRGTSPTSRLDTGLEACIAVSLGGGILGMDRQIKRTITNFFLPAVELPVIFGTHYQFRGNSTELEWQTSYAMEGKKMRYYLCLSFLFLLFFLSLHTVLLFHPAPRLLFQEFF